MSPDARPVPKTPLELARGIFEETWYQADPDSLEDPFAAFVALGPAAADPHPLFSVDYYLRAVPELEETGESPLLHYVREGWRRGVAPHPLFDGAYYVRRYGADLREGEDPLTHYLREGAQRGLQPHPWFDTAYYLRAAPDVLASGIDPLVHFAVFGAREGRRPHPEFDPALHALRRDLPKTANPLIDFLRRLDEARTVTGAPADPVYSVVILNYNKPLLTVQSVVDVLDDPSLRERAEIVVVDNGSTPANFALLRAELPAGVRVLRLDVNRFFGEGNNLGAEIARGEFLVFLNNDAFVDPGALDALRDVFARHPDCGAAGPRFFYPDGRVQESGAMISACGIALQRGKYLSPATPLYRTTEPVDYVSAACVMVRRETFDEIGAFDLIWDPAYYEDTDLGLKLLLTGKRVYYCPAATVVHVENTTSGDAGLALRMNGIVEVNREKFISRWSQWLAGGRDPSARPLALPSRARRPRTRPEAVLFTPYPLYPGGGERYLLTLAEALADRYDVVLATPERYSLWRIRTLARDLGLDLSHVEPIPARELDRHAGCALFVVMGNELYPPVAAQGRHAIFHCQFPFAMSSDHVAANSRHLRGYGAVVVNSEFTARHYRAEAERYGEIPPPVHVVAPPVPQVPPGDEPRAATRILNVGRFSPAGHDKRQDALIDALRELVAVRPDAELHLAGTVPAQAEARDYLLTLRSSALDLPVTFHLNAATHQLEALYRSSSVYWHATGFGRPSELMPQYQEHFGISVVEAMSAGLYPLAYRGGGPPDFIAEGETGELWETLDELVARTTAFLDLEPVVRDARTSAARAAARRFDVATFRARVLDLVAGLEQNDPAARNGVAAAGPPAGAPGSQGAVNDVRI